MSNEGRTNAARHYFLEIRVNSSHRRVMRCQKRELFLDQNRLWAVAPSGRARIALGVKRVVPITEEEER